MSSNAICCSAPGKVLVTGGYMVLERPNAGLVFSVNARFYSVVENFVGKGFDIQKLLPTLSLDKNAILIEVISPQFNHTELYALKPEENFQLKPLSPKHHANPYTEKTIQQTLIAISGIIDSDKLKTLLSRGLSITIVGDNDFYSQRDQLIERGLPLTSSSLLTLPRFLPASSSGLSEMKKTGLGSSAALVTSLVGALMHYFGATKIPIRVPPSSEPSSTENPTSSKQQKRHSIPENLYLVHNLAQYCHCLAQGKVGSGFDVSSAVFGSQRYVRFSESILKPLLDQNSSHVSPTSKELLPILQSKWDNEVTPLGLPPGLQLILGDVSKGSNTPNMVAKVLKWKREHPDAQTLIKSLLMVNDEVSYHFDMLRKDLEDQDSSIYFESLKKCSQVTADKWTEATSNPVSLNLFKLRSDFLKVRTYLRTMGKQADVEVEPESQERLIDETMNIPGVLISGVPGAGGYDAIFAILLDNASASAVESLWIERGVLPLILKEENQGLSVDALPQFANL